MVVMSWMRHSSLWSVCLFLCILISDRISKSWALSSLLERSSIEMWQGAGVEVLLTYATNTGAAWGILNDVPVFLFLLRFLFVSILVYALVCGYFSRSRAMLCKLSLVAILSGAVSNMIDTALYGCVIDMIHIRLWGYDYPIFNIADTAITTGSILFLLGTYCSKKSDMQ